MLTDLCAEGIKRGFAEEMREAFGVDIDVSGFEDSPEGMARFFYHMQEQVRTAKAAAPDEAPRAGKNSKRCHREEQAQQREALTRKSVRDIYLSLAKVLHPDAVTDTVERSRGIGTSRAYPEVADLYPGRSFSVPRAIRPDHPYRPCPGPGQIKVPEGGGGCPLLVSVSRLAEIRTASSA